ncbi:MAG: DUF485 domain-containing protein [Micavibrio aeruginosavorus]|uniref:DUF485 domain-containing protein n=1 Tax=Micavibrio aeruginosavorus TaxID=349221 RepID=A0A2W5BDK5_9BACT|nr:MAG: DUF485 domain-containing protein [Micavibrio aeruginosavorus]
MPVTDFETIRSMPEYQELLTRRRALIVPLSIITLTIYYAFILALAFFPEALSVRVGDGVTTIGIWIGLGVIIATFVITGVYVRKANQEIETLLHTIHQKAGT